MMSSIGFMAPIKYDIILSISSDFVANGCFSLFVIYGFLLKDADRVEGREKFHEELRF